jgi:hypothetical protein
MRDVPSCAFSHEEYLGEVSMGLEPRIGCFSSACGFGLGMKPLESGDGIVISSRETVLGSQSVVDGDDEGAYIGCPLYAEAVDIGTLRAKPTEAAAMSVEDYGQPCRGGWGRMGRRRREIEARPQAVCEIKHDVFV